MKPAPFAYVAPATVEEALAELERGGDGARPLAGGQSLVPLMNFRLARPEILVDLNGIDELDYVRPRDGGIAIGAMTRARALERSPLIAEVSPLAVQALRFVGHPQIRNRGTIGGTLAHADASAEMPAVALALQASLVVRSARGERIVTADEFFVTHFTTALAPDELLLEIRVPPPAQRSGTAFEEFARRRGDFAIAGAAAVVTLDHGGAVASSRLVLIGVADRPLDVSATAASLAGAPVTETAAREVGDAVAATLKPPTDIHASGATRRRIAGALVRRALLAAGGRAREALAAEREPSTGTTTGRHT